MTRGAREKGTVASRGDNHNKGLNLSGHRSAGLAAAGAALIAILTVYIFRGDTSPILTPFSTNKLAKLGQFGGAHAEDYLWSTYRPGQYFGMRMRAPESLLAGLMWFDAQRPDALSNIRHNAQDRDGLRKYGWEAHDGRSFGRQELWDTDLHLTTSWVKRQCRGCGNGGDWALKLEMQQEHQSRGSGPDPDHTARQQPRRASVLFYIADETGQAVSMDDDGAPAAADSRLFSSGQHAIAGAWQLHVNSPGKLSKLRHYGAQTRHMHNLTELVQQAMVPRRTKGQSRTGIAYQLPNTKDDKSNMGILQLTASLPFSAEFIFLGGQTDEQRTIRGPVTMCADCAGQNSDSRAGPEGASARLRALSGRNLVELLKAREAEFDQRFAQRFGQLSQHNLPAGTIPVTKAALSNLLGGVGYFYGSSRIAAPSKGQGTSRMVPSPPSALFTAVPSRSFFPRGFLWDEGFHQLLMSRWDPQMSRDVLAHWLDLMNKQGWIAREQILGSEAEARVPAEFIVQHPDSANPPTLFLVLAQMADDLAVATAQPGGSTADVQHQKGFLLAAFPHLAAWFRWFNTTQAGPVPGSYRWRGRDAQTHAELNPKTLTSGLDDYPRASHPSDQERHVDLRCWMALAARALAKIGSCLNIPSSQLAPFKATAAMLEEFNSLKRLHHDAETGQFLDFGNHSQAVQLQQVMYRTQQGGLVRGPLQRTLTDPSQPPRLQLVPHFGYVSLFPLLMGLLPASSVELGQQLHLLQRTDLLWTPFGLRSLSLTSSIHGAHNTEHDAPYWRGPIWFNINYLALRSLHRYSKLEGQHAGLAADLYSQLRANLLSNLVKVYNQTGYLWENYDETDGHGKGSHPFTGWTALIVLVAGQTY